MNELKHLGLIIDGNRRYATKYGTSFTETYWMGAVKGRIILDWVFSEFKVPELSVYALSHDNLNRPLVQLNPVFSVQAKEYEKWLSDPFFEENGVRVGFYGDFGRLPKDYVSACKKVMEKTKGYGKKKLNILVGYNGQREIASAVRKWLEGHKEKSVEQLVGELDAADPDSRGTAHLREQISNNLDIPSPLDLVIRTGCELRNSGFLTWQSEYAEFYGVPKLWPELTKEDLGVAIKNFGRRARRKGE